MNTITQRVRDFAVEKHGDQKRKYSDAPYIVHLDAVVRLLQSHDITDERVIAAAYLHDTVEDTDTTIQELMSMFGDEVAELVYWLTDAEIGSRRARMAMSSWRLGRAPREAKLIKLADIIDNTKNILEKDPAFAPVFLKEKRAVLVRMVEVEGEAIANHPLYQKAAAQVVVQPSGAFRP